MKLFSKSIKFKNPIKVYEEYRSKNSILLESQKNGRYSYIALNPDMIFRSKNGNITISKGNKVIKKKGDVVKELRKIFYKKILRKNLPLFYSGGIGYFAYDFIKKHKIDDLNLSDVYLIFPRTIIFFDHLKKKSKIISKDMDFSFDKIKSFNTKHNKVNFVSNFKYKDYIKNVNKCIEYIKAGDSFQIKISQRFECTINEDTFEIYKRLRKINPSPYASYMELDGFSVISCSPEHLIKVENNVLETRPIGGTYPVTKKVSDFLKDSKENAEHNMLIDLERNDLGRVASFGSVKVNENKVIEKYSHLIHLVTNIKAKLGKGDVFDVFMSMFPGGTVTGCPKKRTMEIISEMEPISRGLYTGSIGFINYSNEMDFNIIIRTLVVKGNKGYVQVGGGIVADSKPKKEYNETIIKGKALFEAINL